MIEILPSVLACDFSLLKDEMQKAEKAGVNGFHFDVMDYHFVPNLTFGPKIVGDFKKYTSLPIDVHLMVDNPEEQINDFLKLGCRSYTFHIEVEANYIEIFKKVKGLGYQLGMAINPGTDVNQLDPYLEMVDIILVMLVEPGFCGSEIIYQALKKIELLKEKAVNKSLNFKIQVDGGIKLNFIPSLKNYGIHGVVMGSGFFSQSNYEELVSQIRIMWET